MTTAIESTETASAFAALLPAQGANLPQAWQELRQRGQESFAEQGLPTTKMEEWRFTNVARVGRHSYSKPQPAQDIRLEELAALFDPQAPLVVLVDGIWSPELSRIGDLGEGVRLNSLRNSDGGVEEIGSVAQIDTHPFAALNTALFDDGLVLDLESGAVVEEPIFVLSLATAGDEATAFFPRLLVRAGDNSQATLIEQHLSLGSGAYLNAPVTEFRLGANAIIDHYRVQRESKEANHLGLTHVHQRRASAFSSHAITWGGGIVRNDVVAELDGEGADAILNGLYMLEGEQLVDNHMRVEHCQPNTTSHELYKGILEGKSRAVFNGRLYVHRGAQKTDAKQSNRNLLLSDQTIVNSNPQLEIFADDVKCTHGSTTGQLDPEALFYLRSRGIGDVAARSLLTYAFASDIVSRVKVDLTRQDLEEVLFRRLPRGEVVRQAV